MGKIVNLNGELFNAISASHMKPSNKTTQPHSTAARGELRVGQSVSVNSKQEIVSKPPCDDTCILSDLVSITYDIPL